VRLLKEDAIAGDDGLVKCQANRTFDELPDGVII
jgi:hypothetical protein